MESHVLRPIIMGFCIVVALKYCKSFGKCQGMRLLSPTTLLFAVATIKLMVLAMGCPSLRMDLAALYCAVIEMTDLRINKRVAVETDKAVFGLVCFTS